MENLVAPPPLGPELASGKWKVHVRDLHGNITEENVSGKQLWSMQNRRVIVDFNRKGQPIKDSGGLLGSWLGSFNYDFNSLPINYTDWRKVPHYRKDMAWQVIQRKFWFDDPIRRKKYVISTLGNRCKDLKQRLWRRHRKNTLEESLVARPALVPEDQWRDFVHDQFSDKAKKMRERNIKSRSKLEIPHALGKKSLARKAHDIEEETGIEPSRAEMFIASRTRIDGSMICEEATICAEKLKEFMSQKLPGDMPSNDAVAQVFGPEHSGRVRCVGRGPTPSKYFSSFGSTTSNLEMVEMKSKMKILEDKFDIVASALQVLIKSRDIRFQENENGGNKLASALEVLLEACRDIQFHENENGGNINLATAINMLHQVSSSI
ncbi:putative transposase Ptta/En/Spm plant [Arabidopsis thaliana x Arabidopsis arenosa]|uniref:Putative transposase Ptta/En/Spm plant n=1 Tax=Arabidopsis thaliana x Arabidopsis arenosa TaxID=1240361 RepID=A0A8T2BKA1_9BRAS|nr:putative transposase Ptta/En/Spm plant [Arabidopsis thaliana x Arabidopsis arenosa]KAG7585535.1 putative transposase Ptta/En/Spm plant [Arabidopsis thaliana x Arabidopsis arenosa]